MLPESEQHISAFNKESAEQDIEAPPETAKQTNVDIENELNSLFEIEPEGDLSEWLTLETPEELAKLDLSPNFQTLGSNFANVDGEVELKLSDLSDDAFNFNTLFDDKNEENLIESDDVNLDFYSLFSTLEDTVKTNNLDTPQYDSISEEVHQVSSLNEQNTTTIQNQEKFDVVDFWFDEHSDLQKNLYGSNALNNVIKDSLEPDLDIQTIEDIELLTISELEVSTNAVSTLSDSINQQATDSIDVQLEKETVIQSFSEVDFTDLELLLTEENVVDNEVNVEDTLDRESEPIEQTVDVNDEFDELAALLATDTIEVETTEDFAELDALLETKAIAHSAAPKAIAPENEFAELESLLEDEPQNQKSEEPISESITKISPSVARTAFEQTMRVSVKQLDGIGNLVGELVVNRNSLEQDQQRLRQFTENLLHRVQQLNELGIRMQELYERSLLEASLLSSRSHSRSESVDADKTPERHATGMDFDALEMDRFTGFHTLSQEMIEMIVRVRESASDIEFVTDETEQVARQFRQVTTQLQEGITRSRMIPFSQIADRLPRAVKDITLKYGKQADLKIEGRDTLIDKVILEQLYDPMTHLVNNSITHGIETPEERIAQGKPPIGTITIRAFHQGNQTVISVSDDGAGIDPDRVLTKAIQKGLITVAEARTMSRVDVYDLLFHPGFSTKDKVDEFAGRGVGMDVVRTSLIEIRGIINTDSTLGQGTTFTIRLPLTLSICKALCCLSDKARIAFPMDGVEDMLDIPASALLKSEEGQPCVAWRDLVLPLRPLKELLHYNRVLGRGNVYGTNREEDLVSVIILRSAGTFTALQVDQVLGEQEIVIKQFEAPISKPIGIAGATILGDGHVMPIADVLELIDLSLGRIQHRNNEALWTTNATPSKPIMTQPVKTEPTVLIVDDSITVRELLSLTFNKAGYRVEQARDGQEAWDKLRDGLPCDLIFCDIEMPRMDGLELLSRLQQEPSLNEIPIAMLTSRGAERHRQMAIQLGASGYFTKPYLEEVLLDGAARMLQGEMLVVS
ncbi:putative CheA signal transduction histidine kinase [Gloeocapsa sp. PCC 7428]|uniref:hybrid sensor histidine kinase/response regulator n=1 Tax=Gloeocapsa sp. PCC 7428 TaxID=1173026 RepID=UPI0002A5F5D4|nr:hybrid sensor histidine kinase/response regulator [Gloeocapsa sp. PCC 7428]AFZ29696.1 putative CheA signal transduction histidine kinase [Gloeocapsa sp. PCC 7428]